MPIISLSPEDARNPIAISCLRSIVPNAAVLPRNLLSPKPKKTYFNRYLWSEESQVDEAVNYVLDLVYQNPIFADENINRTKLFPVAKIVILNLYRARKTGSEFWVNYSRDKNVIDSPKQYRKSGLSYRRLIAFIDALAEIGQIRHENGFHERNGYRNTRMSRSKLSRMQPTGMIEVFSQFGILPEHISRHPKQELIEKKAKKDDRGKAKLMAYRSTVAVGRMRKVLIAYNQLIKSSDIKLSITPSEFVDFSNTTIKRVFNNASWKEGGRWYGGWWQSIKSNSRQHIIINGSPTVELDYKALHPFMLYQRAGVLWPEGFDPYRPTQYHNQPEPVKLRNLCKDFLLIALNAESELGAIGAMKDALKEDKESGGYRYPTNPPELPAMLQALKEHNASIAHYLNTGIGIHLQYEDSCIAEHIIKTMTREGIPVLCLHDGFRCAVEHKEQLKQLMIDSFKKVTEASVHPVIEEET